MKIIIKIFLVIFIFHSSSCSATSVKSRTSEKLTYQINGYAQIYGLLNALSWADKALILKFESDKVEKLMIKLDQFSNNYLKTIQKLAKTNKWIKFNKTGLPQIQQDILAEKQKERIRNFLPLIGKSQYQFEKELLTSTKDGLDNIIYLTKVLKKVETNTKLKSYLNQLNKEANLLHTKNIILLKKHNCKK